MKARKSPKRNLRIEPSKRKKPTLAKHASHEFKSRRVKPTRRERMMAKASKDYDTDTDTEAATPAATAPEAPKTEAPQAGPMKDDLVSLLELAAKHGAPVSPHMIELAKAGSK